MRHSRYLLTENILADIRHKIKEAGYSDCRVRLLCVYWVGSGKHVNEVAEFLCIESRTVFKYLSDYHNKNKVDSSPKGGSSSHLNKDQTKELCDYISTTYVTSTVELVDYIQEKYGVKYSRGGLSKLLIRNNFRYKRPRRIPRVSSEQDQRDFISFYNNKKKYSMQKG